MEDFLVLAILALVLAVAIIYVVRAKKKGAKCVGCPYANSCGKNTGNGSCSCNTKN